MKKRLFLAALILAVWGNLAYADTFNSGSTGSLGAFNPTTDTVVQLPADGILNYTTINIPAGVTVTFTKNAANTPVYMLATGDVTIAGTVNVSGKSGTGVNCSIYAPVTGGMGGPGGFDGGYGGTLNAAGGAGLGPGGGTPGQDSSTPGFYGAGGGGGSYGSAGTGGAAWASVAAPGSGGSTYGTSQLYPVIGGSGGGGGGSYLSCAGGAGGGGGGAILIATSGVLSVTGAIHADGGSAGSCGDNGSGCGSGGSGGAIKLLASNISGEGTITATGGGGGGCPPIWGAYYCGPGGGGGNGRIRFEAYTVTRTGVTTPAYVFDYPSTVFVANTPSLHITSVGGVNVPANPSGTYGVTDITLPSNTTNPVSITVSASNIPAGTAVTITAVPEYGNSTSTTATLSGDNTSSEATSLLTLSTSYQSILTAQAIFTVQTAMYFDGERIEKVRVASTIGRSPKIVYITESGREIPAAVMAAKRM